MANIYLMSPPRTDWAIRGKANFRSELASPVDLLKARREWLRLAQSIESTGAKVVVAPSSDRLLTGMPYAAEAGNFVPGPNPGDPYRFLLPRMLKPHRVGEAALWKPVVELLGFETIELGQGIWEGQGDVAWFQGVTILFYGGRTDHEGMSLARPYFLENTITLETVDPAFHGNMALLPLEAVGKMLICPDVIVGDGVDRLRKAFGKENLIPLTVDEIKNYATNGLPIGTNIFAPDIITERVHELLESLGMNVTLLAMDELCGKAGGASRCLVCHLPDGPEIDIPEPYSLAKIAEEIL